MKVVFISNFLTHHQVPFCLEMKKRLGEDFKFISTVKIFEWRLKLGFKDLDNEYDFVVKAYENRETYEEAKKLALESDVVIIGSTTDDLLVERLKQDKIIFRYRARIFIFPDGFSKTVFNKEKLQLFYHRHIKFRKNKNLYLLAANAYGPNDFEFLGLYKNKIYKWGYFLETNQYDIDKLIEKKEENKKIEMIWVARFIKWKHPEVILKLAKNLKKEGYNFEIKMLGTGVLEEKIRKQVKEQGLDDVINIVGQVPSDKVKEYMEKANIFLGTSDQNEGWGAVINESMNAGCSIIANRRMGSVPFLIQDGETGFQYDSYKELENRVKQLMNDKDLREKLGKNAYQYITRKWTSSIAAENLIELFNSIINHTEFNVTEGPASKALLYKRSKK